MSLSRPLLFWENNLLASFYDECSSIMIFNVLFRQRLLFLRVIILHSRWILANIADVREISDSPPSVNRWTVYLVIVGRCYNRNGSNDNLKSIWVLWSKPELTLTNWKIQLSGCHFSGSQALKLYKRTYKRVRDCEIVGECFIRISDWTYFFWYFIWGVLCKL